MVFPSSLAPPTPTQPENRPAGRGAAPRPSLQRLARVRTTLLQPRRRLDHDPCEPAAPRRRWNRLTESDAREAAVGPRSRRRDGPSHSAVRTRSVQPAAALPGRRGLDTPRKLLPRRPAPVSRQPLSCDERLGWMPSSVIPLLTLEPADAAGQPEHRRDLDSGHAAEALERRGVQHRYQPPQILAKHVVQRHAVRCLVSLAAHERRPVALGEEREREADDEKRCRDDRVAGVAGE